MSVSSIRSLVKRSIKSHLLDHTPLVHEEVQAMIDAALDRGPIRSPERAALLGVLSFFGSHGFVSHLLSASDEQALKDTILSGMETRVAFQKLRIRDQAVFLIRCVALGKSECIGLFSLPASPEQLPPNELRCIERVIEQRYGEIDAKRYGPPEDLSIDAVTHNHETYGYIVNVYFPACDKSGDVHLMCVFGPAASFHREVICRTEDPDYDGD
jgi:hypothetical protein